MRKPLLIALILSIASVSCIKKEYNLSRDNLDLTIKIGDDDLYIPIGSTDSLFLKNFLKPDEVELLDTLNGGYVIIHTDFTDIDIPSIDTTHLKVANIVETIVNSIDFSGSVDFPNVDLPNISKKDTINSDFWLPIAPPAPISAGALALPPYNLPLSTVRRDTVSISISQVFPDMIAGVDTVLLNNSNLEISLDIRNVPNGVSFTLDSLFLVFPSQVKLGAAEGVVSSNVYLLTNRTLITGTPLVLTVPVYCLDFSTTPLQNQALILDEEIRVFSKYSLGGTYVGGSFPNSAENSTRLILDVASNLNFGSAMVRFNTVEQAVSATAPIDIVANNIPTEIVSLDSILLQNTQIKLALNLNPTVIGGQNMNVRLNIQFPKNILFASPQVSSTNVFEQNVTFVDGKWETTFNIRGLKYGRSIINQTIEINDSVVVKASATLSGLKMNTDTLRNTILTINANTSLTNIKFSKVYGKISPNIPSKDVSVSLTNLPPLLKNNRDSIILDVKPYLDLVMNTNLQIPFGATVILKPYKNDTVIAEGEQQVSIQVPASLGVPAASKFWIADTDAKMPTEQGYQFVKADLGAVVKHIPDSIRISVDANTDPNAQAIFDLNTAYRANLNYQFVVPLAFGPNLQIMIQDTIKDLGSLVGKLLSGNQVGLTGTIWNSIPLDLVGTVVPIDSNYNVITIDPIEKLIIKSGNANGTTVQSDFELTFKDPNKRLQDLRGFIFRFDGQTGANTVGVPIKPDNFIRARLNAKIVDGAVIDLNDLKK